MEIIYEKNSSIQHQLDHMDKAIETGLQQLALGNKVTTKKSYTRLKKKINKIKNLMDNPELYALIKRKPLKIPPIN